MEAERTCLDCREVRSWWVFSKDLRLLQKNASKPSTVPLLANDGTPLSSDTDKLKRRAEHFSNVVNGPTEISVDSLSNLPSVAPSVASQSLLEPHTEHVRETGSQESNILDIDALCSTFTREEILDAVSQLYNGRAPGIDEIPVELLKLGGEHTIEWLKNPVR